jgi:septal ring factor EnvC (AmiA/AmiB activator)
MRELLQMSVDHLNNIKREVSKLEAQRTQIESEIVRLNKYVEDGAASVEKYRDELSKQDAPLQSAPESPTSTIFN